MYWPDNELSGKGHAEDRCPWSVRALWSRFAKPPLAVTRANRQKIGKKLPPALNGGTPGLLGIKRHQILYRSTCLDRVFCFEILVLIFYDSWYKGSLHKAGTRSFVKICNFSDSSFKNSYRIIIYIENSEKLFWCFNFLENYFDFN